MSVEGTSVSCGIWCCYCAIAGCCITSSHPRFSAEHCTSLQWRNNIFGSLPEVVQCKSNSQFNILTSLSITVEFACFVLPWMKMHPGFVMFICVRFWLCSTCLNPSFRLQIQSLHSNCCCFHNLTSPECPCLTPYCLFWIFCQHLMLQITNYWSLRW